VISNNTQQETKMMKTMLHRAVGLKVWQVALLAVATSLTAYAPSGTAGHGAAWGIGGLLAGHFLTDMYNSKQQEQKAPNTMAYGNPSAPKAAPAAPATSAMTPEQKLQQLDKLAAGGYITPAEYKARRQTILDSL
jgi:hypothetical protein